MTRTGRRPRPRWRSSCALLGALLCVWAWLGLAKEAWIASTRLAGPPPNIKQPSRWILGSRQPRELAEFLGAVAAVVPKDEPVVFVGRQSGAQNQRYEYLWASYLMPERDVLPAAAALDYPPARFVAFYGKHPGHEPGSLTIEVNAGGAIRRIGR